MKKIINISQALIIALAVFFAPKLNAQPVGKFGGGNGDGYGRANTSGGFIQLSVDLLHFSARAEQQEVLLEWSTENEKAFSHFEVQRSVDGLAFESIGSRIGSGLEGETENYRFPDHHPLSGINYYRLKSVDKNGAYYLSRVERVFFEEVNTLTIYPHPVRDIATISVSSRHGGKYNFALTDVRGKRIFASQKSLQSGLNTLQFDFSNLSAGIYIFEAESGLVRQNQRLLILP